MVGSGIRHVDERLQSPSALGFHTTSHESLGAKAKGKIKSIADGLANVENLIP